MQCTDRRATRRGVCQWLAFIARGIARARVYRIDYVPGTEVLVLVRMVACLECRSSRQCCTNCTCSTSSHRASPIHASNLVAKGRAQVGVAASSGDWSKRIRDMQYTDHEDYTVGS